VYQPFIDDPEHLARLDGQRFVVLRPTGGVAQGYTRVRTLIQSELAHLPVSYPAQPHVTLAGFAEGTHVDAVRALVAEWAPTVAPLRVELESVGFFPSPFQIVFVQVHKTPELFDALSSLGERARWRKLADVATIAPADWIFHMSVAYCTSLSEADWLQVTRVVETVNVPPAQCTIREVEIVAFDGGQERSAGVLALSRGDAPP
jgi:2'-5' RNA ligase